MRRAALFSMVSFSYAALTIFSSGLITTTLLSAGVALSLGADVLGAASCPLLMPTKLKLRRNAVTSRRIWLFICLVLSCRWVEVTECESLFGRTLALAQ